MSVRNNWKGIMEYATLDNMGLLVSEGYEQYMRFTMARKTVPRNASR
jgi:hypothetical protein